MTESQREYDTLIAPIESRMIGIIWGITQNAEDAEEAMQDALYTIWRRWGRVRSHPNPAALVLRMCANAAYDRLRQRIRRRKWMRDAAERSCLERWGKDDVESPEARLAGNEELSCVMAAIAGLPRNQAIALTMRLVQEESYDAIGGVIGCAPATARKHVERGRVKLRARLRNDGYLPGKEASNDALDG